jgi:hypothetical protein
MDAYVAAAIGILVIPVCTALKLWKESVPSGSLCTERPRLARGNLYRLLTIQQSQ